MRTAKTLIRLGGCPGWSQSSLGAHSFCWFCPCRGSNYNGLVGLMHSLSDGNIGGNNEIKPDSNNTKSLIWGAYFLVLLIQNGIQFALVVIQYRITFLRFTYPWFSQRSLCMFILLKGATGLIEPLICISEQNIQQFLLEPTRRAFLKDLYSGKYPADLSKRPKNAEAMASFRKLNVS